MLPITNKLRTEIAQHLPGLIGKPIQLIPFSIYKQLVTKVLQRIFKEALKNGDMDFLEGLCIRFEIEDCKLHWIVTIKDQNLKILDTNHADANIRCKMREFVLLANRRVDPDTLFFQRRLIIEGNTELGLTMKNLMDTLDPESLPLPLVKGLQAMEYILTPK